MNAKTRIRKKVLSLHGLHGLHSLHSLHGLQSAVCSLQSAWSAFWGDRLSIKDNYPDGVIGMPLRLVYRNSRGDNLLMTESKR